MLIKINHASAAKKYLLLIIIKKKKLSESESIDEEPAKNYENVAEDEDDEDSVRNRYSNFSLFMTYFRAGASWYVFGFYILIVILTQVASSGTDYWLSYWTNIEDVRYQIGLNSSSQEENWINKYNPSE